MAVQRPVERVGERARRASCRVGRAGVALLAILAFSLCHCTLVAQRTRSLRAPSTDRAPRETDGPPVRSGSATADTLAAPEGSAHAVRGLAIGEIGPHEAVVWVRCDRAAVVDGMIDPPGVAFARDVPATDDHDFTTRIRIGNLQPATAYDVRVSCTPAGAETLSGNDDPTELARGSFRTAPEPNAPAPLRFAWGGDLGGQNVCRDVEEGYPILNTIAARRPDFFIGLGDMIYADDPCLPTGRYGNAQVTGPPPATDLPSFWAHWRYNWEEDSLRRLLSTTPYFAVWDDHEVVDDFGPHHDMRMGRHLLPAGLAAFLDYAPMLPVPAAPPRLFRSVRWGRHLEVIFLDTRQYRDSNFTHDSPRSPKTLLGVEQRAWLERRLADSDATWLVIVSSVPLAVPTGGLARDGWASGLTRLGFEEELGRILRVLQRRKRNAIWITTDVHFAAAFRYRPFRDDPTFTFHELITGPLNAGLYPREDLDPTFRPERLFAYGPGPTDQIATSSDALPWFNFGVIEIDEAGRLVAEIVDGTGATRYRLALSTRSE